MKISNFTLHKTEGKSPIDLVFRASVEVESGFFIWKKKEHKDISRKYCDHWFFDETGKYVPSIVNDLARAWTAKTGQET